MKRKMLVIAILVLFFYSSAAQYVIPGNLATFAQYETTITRGAYKQEVQKIIDNQLKPIIETFELPVSLQPFEDRKNDTLSINYFRALSGSGPVPDYTIERNGKKLNEVSDTVQLGDTVSFSPPQTNSIPVTGDWVNPGGSLQDPPIKTVTQTRMIEIRTAVEAKFNSRYPFAYRQGARSNISVPKFSAKKTRFDTSTGKYIADNGDPAYIVPAGNGKKFGIQVYCTTRIGATGKRMGTGGQNYFYCNEQLGKIECPIKTTGTISVQLNESYNCLTIIDKVFIGENAIQADWVLDGPSYSITHNLTLQALESGKKAPVADFDCKVTEGEYYGRQIKFLECDASKSHDPDGKITKYEWGSAFGMGQGIHYKKPVYYGNNQYSITLRVTDNDGFYDTKTKTFNLAQMPAYNTTGAQQAPAPIIELAAEYNPKTQMAEVTAKCDTKTINININNAVTGNSVLEKQAIPCNQTTPIGPIKAKGAYKVSATGNNKVKPVIFTINSKKQLQ